MGSFLYFAIVIQFTNAFATQAIPLKCFLQDGNFLNPFSTNAAFASSYIVPPTNPLRLDTMWVKEVRIDKDDWFHDAINIEYQGLSDAILDEFRFNLISKVSQITFHTDLLVTYFYKTNGTLFSLPIDGEGFSEVLLNNIEFGMTMPFDIIEVNGNKFIELRNFNYWYNVKDNTKFNFSNLYHGNKKLSDTMHNLMNRNWQFMASHFGKVFYDKLSEKMFNVFRNYMLATPLKDFTVC